MLSSIIWVFPSLFLLDYLKKFQTLPRTTIARKMTIQQKAAKGRMSGEYSSKVFKLTGSNPTTSATVDYSDTG